MKTKPHFQTALSLAVALALGACAVNPKVDAPTVESSGHIISAAETADRYNVSENWWETYQNPPLNALINQAFANNIDLKQAALNVNKALYQAKILRADLVPSFSGSLGASTSKNLKTGGSPSDSFSSQLGLSYELDLWQKLRASANAQAWEYRATQEDLANTRLTLANNVADAYFNIAYLNEAITLTEKTVKQYEAVARISNTKYRLGKSDSSEPTQSNQSLLGARSSLLTLKTNRDTLEQTLRNLLNLKPGEAPAVAPAQYRLPAAKGVDLNVPISVLANRPDLRAAEYRLQSSVQSLAAQKRSWYPSITLGASLSTSSDKARSTFNIPVLGGSAQINLPFLNWKTLKWNDKTAEANYEAAKLDFEKALTTALNEVDTNYLAYQNAQATLKNQQQRYALDRKNSRYYQVRYQYGKNELKDWLEALNTEYGSAQNLLNQRYEVLKYENMIYKAMAGRYTVKR
ncbi:TolC family protein [Neisseria chenwenguii]|uniref:Transporter n=1 Tax=Neisseria chenwenguii TaxID=1853278 RepID=A0A220S3U7_9NEIS|nr:TolC family protein [Neisseria chenwenguii]ASK28072.1 transporter [Neisseria chenwenguii]ROV57222.1 TolC family protein [Neisseria chenwenguii]